MELTQALDQRLTVSPQLILANKLLQYSSAELDQAISQELARNPALELDESRLCPRCKRPLPRCRCRKGERPLRRHERGDEAWSAPPPDIEEVAARPLLSPAPSLADHLLQQARLHLPPHDLTIAVYLIDSLDERGFLCADLDELALEMSVESGRVEQIVALLQTLDPPGIAARDARECLLLQLQDLDRRGRGHSLAQAIVRDHWEALGRYALAEIARATGCSSGDVQAAIQFIRDNLCPFPAYTSWGDQHHTPVEPTAAPPEPDVIIYARGSGAQTLYEIELPEQEAYPLRISPTCAEAVKEMRALPAGESWEEWQSLCMQARLFIKSLEQRWQTLHRIVRFLVDYQRPFLRYGQRRMRPLTRAALAAALGLHESTVSRAVAGKYVQLPDGCIVPLACFFDRAAPVREAIKELVAQEEKPLSDREIAARLKDQGFVVSRRTVTKYRNALHILPSWLRGRSREMAHQAPVKGD